MLDLTPEERDELVAVSQGPLRSERLHIAVPPGVVRDHASDDPPEVLFCSRLHARKRPQYFVAMARRLLADGARASFVLVGPDEGEGPAVAASVAEHGDPDTLRWEGSLDRSETVERISRASLLVLPAVQEPYPLAVLEVLEVMAVGRPVVITASNGLAPAVAAYGCGQVVDESVEQLVEAVRTYLADPAALAEAGRRVAAATRTHFSLEAVASRLEAVYERALSS